MTSYSFTNDLRQRLTDNLAALDIHALDGKDLRHAAVAIVVVAHPETEQACVLLTLRPDRMNRHAGQYALPGGRLDEGENQLQASLRELQEELGVTLGPDDQIGTLDDYPTRSGFRITPLVFWAESPVTLTPDPVEVDQVFHITLEELDCPNIPILSDPEPGERPVLSAHLATLGHEVYAPTAAMLYQFREVAMRGEATRVAEYDQPTFAWK